MPIAASLNEKLGPLPVWAWGALAGGTILAGEFIYKRKHPAAAPAAPASNDGTVGTTGPTAPGASPTVTSDGAFFAGGSFVPSSSAGYTLPDTSIATPPAITDNDQWIRTAGALVGAGNAQFSLIQIDEALKAYVDGRPVTALQAAIIELALRAAGSPPYSVPPIQVIPISTPPLTTAPSPAPAPIPTAGGPAQVPPAQTHTAPSWNGPPWGWLPTFLSGVRFVKGSGPAVYDVTPMGLEWVPDEATLARMKVGLPVEQQTVRIIPNQSLYPLPRLGTLPPADATGDPTLAW